MKAHKTKLAFASFMRLLFVERHPRVLLHLSMCSCRQSTCSPMCVHPESALLPGDRADARDLFIRHPRSQLVYAYSGLYSSRFTKRPRGHLGCTYDVMLTGVPWFESTLDLMLTIVCGVPPG